MLVFLSSCIAKDYQHGYSFSDLQITDDEIIERVKPSKTGEIDVLKLLGSPTTLSDYGDRTFFYIWSDEVVWGPSKPRVVNQKILAVSFNENHIVRAVKFYDIRDAKNIECVSDRTKIKGKKIGIIEQFIQNIGRFNNTSKRSAR